MKTENQFPRGGSAKRKLSRQTARARIFKTTKTKRTFNLTWQSPSLISYSRPFPFPFPFPQLLLLLQNANLKLASPCLAWIKKQTKKKQKMDISEIAKKLGFSDSKRLIRKAAELRRLCDVQFDSSIIGVVSSLPSVS